MNKQALDTSAQLAARLAGADCDSCPLKGSVPVMPKPNTEAKLIVVIDHPNKEEVKRGRTTWGDREALLNRVLAVAGADKERDIAVTSATLCNLRSRKISSAARKQAILACRPRLHSEISRTTGSPTIVTLGHGAHQALTGHAKAVDSWAGGPVQGQPAKVQKKKILPLGEKLDFTRWTVVPTFGLDRVLGDIDLTPALKTHVKRAYQLAVGSLKLWEWPELHIDPTPDAVQALTRILNTNLPVSVDIETQGLDPRRDAIMCLALSNGRDTVCLPWERYESGKYGYVKALSEYGPIGKTCYLLVKAILERQPLIGHNVSYDISGIRAQCKFDISNDQLFFDTLLAHAVVAPKLPHGLWAVASLFLHAPPWKALFGVETDLKGAARFKKRPQHLLRTYCAKDALVPTLLREPLQKLIDDTHNGPFLHKRMMDKARVLLRMSDVGIWMSQQHIEEHKVKLAEQATKAKAKYQQLAGYDINPNAAAQNFDLFFRRLKATPYKKSKATGVASTDAETLEHFVATKKGTVRDAASALLDYRKATKLLSTYAKPFPNRDRHGVIHTAWNAAGTRTGRLSSSPNLQNIPKEMRNVFRPRPGYQFLEADYSQLELRVVSYLAGATKLIEMYAAGVDVHQANADNLFKRKATKQERRRAKTFAYACLYGAAPTEIHKRMVADDPELEVDFIKNLYNAFFSLHPEIYRWQRAIVRLAQQSGYVEAPLSGRRQYYYDKIVDPNEVMNFPAQATGADIIDPATISLHDKLDWEQDRIIIQGHDSMLFETKDPQALMPLVRQEMEIRTTLNGYDAFFPIDFQIGESWGDMVEQD